MYPRTAYSAPFTIARPSRLALATLGARPFSNSEVVRVHPIAAQYLTRPGRPETL